jgi:hypothetical protein
MKNFIKAFLALVNVGISAVSPSVPLTKPDFKKRLYILVVWEEEVWSASSLL